MFNESPYKPFRRMERIVGYSVILTTLFSGFALDWNYASDENRLVTWVFGTKQVLLFVTVFLIGFLLWSLRVKLPLMKRKEKDFLLKYILLVAFFFLVVCLERILPSNIDQPFDLKAYWGFLELPFWALLGYSYHDEHNKTEWLFGRLAALVAICSVISFVLRQYYGDDLQPRVFGPAGWPFRFFFLFGFWWYFSKFFVEKRRSWNLLGFFACFLEVVGTLHKPFVVCAITVVPVIILLTLLKEEQFSRTAIRLGVVTALISTLVFFLNLATGGAITDSGGSMSSICIPLLPTENPMIHMISGPERKPVHDIVDTTPET